jgi:hypothetical protein
MPPSPGAAASRTALVHTDEVDEEHRFTGAVRMRHAGAQAAGDERQMRIGIAGFHRPLVGVEIVAALELVVLVAGPFREQGTERIHVRRHVLLAQPRRKAPIEKASGGVGGPVENARQRAQRLMFRLEACAQIDDVEPCLGGELERQIERFIGHSVSCLAER